jgi:hypothetical protein
MPSLHDIVKDFADAQTEPAISRQAHRRMVNMIRTRRPGQFGWNADHTEGRLSDYILTCAEHHVEHGWLSDWATDEIAQSWLDDYAVSQDIVPLSCASFLGTERVSELAKHAERAGEWFKAAKRWSAAGLVQKVTNYSLAMPFWKACTAALERMQPATSQQADAKDRLELSTIGLILQAWDSNDMPVFKSRLERLMHTQAANDSVDGRVIVSIMSKVYPEFFAPTRKGLGTEEERRFAYTLLELINIYRGEVDKTDVGTRRRTRALVLMFAFNVGPWLHHLAELPEFDWDATFGPNGHLLVESAECYVFDKHHKLCCDLHSWDGHVRPLMLPALILHYGALQSANSIVDRSMLTWERFLRQHPPCGMTLTFALLEWPQYLHLLGRGADALHMLRLAHCDWASVDATVRMMRARTPFLGDMSVDEGTFIDMHDLAIGIRMLWALCAPEGQGPSIEQVLCVLPPPEKLSRLGRFPAGPASSTKKTTHAAHFNAMTSLVYPALVLEKYGQVELALTYVEKALDTDFTEGGSTCMWHQSLAYRCRGRVLAATGEMVAARSAFEASEVAAASRQCWMLEALAIRDLVEHVLEPCGQLAGRSPKQRLAPFVAKLSGKRDELAKVVGQRFV